MAVGIRIRDPDTGEVTLQFSDRIGRVMGIASGNSSGGSITEPALSQGAPFAFVQMTQGITFADTTPQVTVSGTTITYTGSAKPFRVLYGAY